MKAMFVIGIIVVAGFILLGVLWNTSANTPKKTGQSEAQPETVALKRQVDKLSESLKIQSARYDESQKEIVRLNTQISQLLGNEAAIKTESEVISKTQTQEVSKLNTTLIILRDEVSKRKAEINRLQKEKEELFGSDTQRDAVINNLKEENAKLEKRIKELEENLSKLSDQGPPPVQYIAWNDNTIMELPKDKIIVVGNMDDAYTVANSDYSRIEDVLLSFNLGYILVSKVDFDKDTYSLDNKWAVLFNSETRNNNAVFSDKTISKIQKFANTGGYIFTEHLDYEFIIERAFKWGFKRNTYLPAKEVSFMAHPAAAMHPYLYLNNIFLEKTGSSTSPEYKNVYQWKVEDGSPDIKVSSKGYATPLIVSPELARVNNGDGIIAITFNANVKSTFNDPNAQDGRVLHIVGILGRQNKSLHKLILNFLAELNQRRPKVK